MSACIICVGTVGLCRPYVGYACIQEFLTIAPKTINLACSFFDVGALLTRCSARDVASIAKASLTKTYINQSIFIYSWQK